MTSDIDIVVSGVLEGARASRADPAPTADRRGVVLATAPSISSAAVRAMEHWCARLDAEEASAERSADLLVECVTAYEVADTLAQSRMSALGAVWARE
ncbi:hypothetical protein [Sanguibacter sp. 25GB23B1]|uniref:hypothetical protein n=1 Tax=unclassified Sanguibacter TaxID=2645534 RepID=UPI0032AFC32F